MQSNIEEGNYGLQVKLKIIGGIMKYLSLALAIMVLSGCGDIRVVHDNPFEAETKTELVTEASQYIKSYEIGVKKTARIGDSIVSWQDTTIKTTTKYTAIPEKFVAKYDFELKGRYIKRSVFPSNIHIKSNKNDEYYLIGTTYYNHKKYYVVGKNKDDNDYYLLVNFQGVVNKNTIIDGSLDRKLVSDDPLSSPDYITMSIIPYSKVKESRLVEISKGISREIIFGGVNDITLNATYREYSPEDMARQTFYQNLVYQTPADIISFRGFKIKVHEVTNENITYTVLEDGLSNPKADANK